MNTLTIAEAGKNWLTSPDITIAQGLENAKQLALSAKACGAHIIKYQTHVWEDEQNLRDKSRAEWTLLNERLTPYEDFWIPLKDYCFSIGLEFMSTPMSKLAGEKINPLIKRWKIGSGNIQDTRLLEYVGATGKPVIFSTGMSIVRDIDKAITILRKRTKNLSLMHCVSEYPCPEDKVNLSLISFYKRRYQPIEVGWSDHTLSTDIPMIAVAIGATIVEKHFTLDRDAYGPDHKASLLPHELEEMIQKIDWVEKVMGEPKKEVTEIEEGFRKIFRKV